MSAELDKDLSHLTTHQLMSEYQRNWNPLYGAHRPDRIFIEELMERLAILELEVRRH